MNEIKEAINTQLDINHNFLKQIRDDQRAIHSNNPSDDTTASKCIGKTSGNAQKQILVTSDGKQEVEVKNTANVKLEDLSSQLNSGITNDPNNSIAVGLRCRTDPTLASTETFLACESGGKQLVAVMGNTEKDGSGTYEHLHTDGNGNLNTQVINTLSVNAFRTTIGSGATNSHALVDAAGHQAVNVFGNNSGTAVQLKVDANGVLETSGGGGGSSDLTYFTATLINSGTAVADGASASGDIDLGVTTTKVPENIWISVTNASAGLGGSGVQASISVQISADNSFFTTPISFIPVTTFTNNDLISLNDIAGDNFSPPRYLRFVFTNNDGGGNSTDISLKINYYA